MKLLTSSKHDTSTLPTIPNSSFAHHDQKSISRPCLQSQLQKIKQLESILINCDHQKSVLLQKQQQLRKVLEEKLRLVQIILNQKNDKAHQQPSQQCQETHENQVNNHINYCVFKRTDNHRTSQFRPEKTTRKFYSALNSPRAQLCEEQNDDITISGAESTVYTDEEIKKAFSLNYRSSLQAKTPQTLLKSSNIRRQNLQSYLNKYKTIQAIWNESDTRHKQIKHSQLRKTYL